MFDLFSGESKSGQSENSNSCPARSKLQYCTIERNLHLKDLWGTSLARLYRHGTTQCAAENYKLYALKVLFNWRMCGRLIADYAVAHYTSDLSPIHMFLLYKRWTSLIDKPVTLMEISPKTYSVWIKFGWHRKDETVHTYTRGNILFLMTSWSCVVTK